MSKLLTVEVPVRKIVNVRDGWGDDSFVVKERSASGRWVRKGKHYPYITSAKAALATMFLNDIKLAEEEAV